MLKNQKVCSRILFKDVDMMNLLMFHIHAWAERHVDNSAEFKTRCLKVSEELIPDILMI
jgi:hypothetical protein